MPTFFVRSPTGRVQDEGVVAAERHDPRPKVVDVGGGRVHVVLGARPEPLPWDCLPIDDGYDDGHLRKLALKPGLGPYTLEELTRMSYAYESYAAARWRKREEIYLEERRRDGGRMKRGSRVSPQKRSSSRGRPRASPSRETRPARSPAWTSAPLYLKSTF